MGEMERIDMKQSLRGTSNVDTNTGVGALGSVKKGGLLGRNVTITINGEEKSVNRGSLIDFLNSNITDPKDALNKSFELLGGSSDKRIDEVFKKVAADIVSPGSILSDKALEEKNAGELEAAFNDYIKATKANLADAEKNVEGADNKCNITYSAALTVLNEMNRDHINQLNKQAEEVKSTNYRDNSAETKQLDNQLDITTKKLKTYAAQLTELRENIELTREFKKKLDNLEIPDNIDDIFNGYLKEAQQGDTESYKAAYALQGKLRANLSLLSTKQLQESIKAPPSAEREKLIRQHGAKANSYLKALLEHKWNAAKPKPEETASDTQAISKDKVVLETRETPLTDKPVKYTQGLKEEQEGKLDNAFNLYMEAAEGKHYESYESAHRIYNLMLASRLDLSKKTKKADSNPQLLTKLQKMESKLYENARRLKKAGNLFDNKINIPFA